MEHEERAARKHKGDRAGRLRPLAIAAGLLFGIRTVHHSRAEALGLNQSNQG
jgi:hypothetical protein